MATGSGVGVVFRRSLWDSRLSILGWGAIGAMMAMMIASIYPTIMNIEGFDAFLQNPIVQALAGDVSAFNTATGFLGTKFFAGMPMALAIFSVVVGLGMVSREEERGTLDVLLSTPIPRWQVVVEKFLAMMVSVVLILGFMSLGFAVAKLLTPALDITLSALVMANVGMFPLLVVIGALTLLVSTIVRSGRLAAGIAATIIVASYFLGTLGEIAEVLSTVRYLSFWTYYDGVAVLAEGVNWGYFAFLLAVAAVMFAASLWFFQRRDLGT